MPIALAIPPLTAKNRGGGALIQDCVLNRANTVLVLSCDERNVGNCPMLELILKNDAKLIIFNHLSVYQ